MGDLELTFDDGHRFWPVVFYDNEQRPVVTMNSDGTVAVAEGVDLDATARAWWDALARSYPAFLPSPDPADLDPSIAAALSRLTVPEYEGKSRDERQYDAGQRWMLRKVQRVLLGINPAGPGPVRCGVIVDLEGAGSHPCVVELDEDGGHDGECVTQLERDQPWPPASTQGRADRG